MADDDRDRSLRVVSSVGQLKGIAVKAGQLTSHLDLTLPPEMKAVLSVLQTHSPPMPFDEVRAIVERELGARGAALLARMTTEPAAAASIGQVHRATLPDGTDVAVKVQYLGIDRAIASDFRPASIGTRFVGLLVPGGDVDSVLREARRAPI